MSLGMMLRSNWQVTATLRASAELSPPSLGRESTRCHQVDGIACTQMIVTVQEGKGDDKALTEKQVAAYFKQFTKSSK